VALTKELSLSERLVPAGDEKEKVPAPRRKCPGVHTHGYVEDFCEALMRKFKIRTQQGDLYRSS